MANDRNHRFQSQLLNRRAFSARFSSLLPPVIASLKPRRALSLFAVLLALVCLAPRSRANNRIFEHSYALAPGGAFLLENFNGSVYIAGWNRNEVDIEAVKSSQSAAASTISFDPAPAVLDSVQIDVQSDPHRIAVRTLYPHGEGAEVGVEYHVRVPNRVLLEAVATVNGAVHVHGVIGSGVLHSVNGDVEVLASSGRFSAKTTNGNVHLELRQLTGAAPMNLETVNGSVVLGLPANARANLQVTHLNGDFTSEIPVNWSGPPSASPAFRARLGTGGAEISVRTINGAIRLVREPSALSL